jgi:transketolase
VRVMRAPSRVLYGDDFKFEFGKAWSLSQSADDSAVIVSSGRGVHEALAAAKECAALGVHVGVVDMPSIDEDVLAKLCRSDKLVVFAEQNNGFLWQNCLKAMARRGGDWNMGRIMAVNTLDREGKPQFIHSGTYEELLQAFSLSPAGLARKIVDRLNENSHG